MKKKLLLVALALAGGVMVYATLPDVKRYIEISRM